MAEGQDEIQRALGHIEGQLQALNSNMTRLMSEIKEDRADHKAKFAGHDERLRKVERNQTYIVGVFTATITALTFFKDAILSLFR